MTNVRTLIAISALLGSSCIVSTSGESDDDSLNRELLALTDKLDAAATADRPQIIRDMTAVATKRKQDVLDMVRSDPTRALDLAIPSAARDRMPPQVRALVEEHVDLFGTVETVGLAYEGPSDGPALRSFLNRPTDRQELHYSPGIGDTHSNHAVRVSGVRVENHIAVDDITVLANQSHPGDEGGATALAGAQSVLTIAINFQNEPTEPKTLSELQELVFTTTSNWYREVSFDTMWLEGDITGWHTIPYDNTACSYRDIYQLALDAATNAGSNPAAYDKHVVLFPSNRACGWAGIATVGGSMTLVNGALSNVRVVGHELGHNFGLLHARAALCDETPISGTCRFQEYGNRSDIMGSSTGHFNAMFKQNLGWLGTGSYPPITTVTSPGTYELAPYAANDTGTKALKILKSTDLNSGRDTHYYVEYRAAVGQDSAVSSALTDGVVVTVGSGSSNYLLDMDGATTTAEALRVGQSFTDPWVGITITLQSLAGGNAQVQVDFADTDCIQTTPGLVADVSSVNITQPGVATTIPFTVTNNNIGCAAQDFSLSFATSLVESHNLTPTTMSLVGGATQTGTLTVVPRADLSPLTTYVTRFYVKNQDDFLNQGSATFSLRVESPDCVRRAPTLSLAPATQTGAAGSSADYTLTVTNNDTGCSATHFRTLPTLPAGWSFTTSSQFVYLSAGSSRTNTLTVTSPTSANANIDFPVAAFHDDAPELVATQTASFLIDGSPTCVRAAPALTITPGRSEVGLAGDTATYTVAVTNRDSSGCAASDLSLQPSAPQGWAAQITSPLRTEPGATTTTTLRVTSASDATAGDYPIGVTAQHPESSELTATFSVTQVVGEPECVRAPPLVTVSPEQATAKPGATTAHTVQITNRDSSTCDNASFALDSTAPQGWTTSPVGAVTLAPGATNTTTVNITSGPNSAAGDYIVALAISHSEDTTLTTAFDIGVAISTAELAATVTTSATAYDHRDTISILVTATVDDVPQAGATVHVDVTDPLGATKSHGPFTTTFSGVAELDLRLRRKSERGTYTVAAQVSHQQDETSANTTFDFIRHNNRLHYVTDDSPPLEPISGGCAAATTGGWGATALLLALLCVRRRSKAC